MIKTQVQIPDRLYRRVKQVAATHEISMAEVVRRGLEYIVSVYPEPQSGTWELPSLPKGCVREGIDELDLKALLDEEDIQL